MKRLSTWVKIILGMLLFVAVCIAPFFASVSGFFSRVYEFSGEKIGVFIINVVSVPFGIFGGINFIRGFLKLCADDVDALGITSQWGALLYFLANVFGIAALCWFAAWAIG